MVTLPFRRAGPRYHNHTEIVRRFDPEWMYLTKRDFVGSGSVPNLGLKDAADATVPAAAWSSRSGVGPGSCISLNGSSQFVTLPDNAFDGVPQATLSIRCALPSGAAVYVVSDGDGVDGAVWIIATASSSAIRMTTDLGGAGVELLTTSNAFRVGTFYTIGVEWGPGGKKCFVNGGKVGENTSLTGVAGTGLNAPRIGRTGGAYSAVKFVGIMYTFQRIGEYGHRIMHRFYETGVR